jgi:hypothetical protein
MARLFADLHCHPAMFQFNRLRHSVDDGHPSTFHPWRQLDEDLKAMNKGARATAYSQSDMAKMSRGRLRIVFASITPVEREFMGPDPAEATNPAAELVKLATGVTAARVAAAATTKGLRGAVGEATALLKNQGPMRRAFQNAYMRFGKDRIAFMMSEDFDYWDEFLREYAFYRAANGEERTVQMRYVERGRERTESHTGRYELIDSLERFDETVPAEGEGEGPLAILLTIEGSHTFTMAPDRARVPDDVLFERIDELKALEHPIFFVTLAHHFDNGVCGHARSIPDAGAALLDQSVRMHEGLERERDLGPRVIRAMLGLDEDLEDTGARRILIDVKHMSARSRKEYYAEILAPANAKLGGPGQAPKIPIVFSHAAYSGVGTLDEMIANAHLEDNDWCLGAFRAWNINASDDDMRAIHDSEGLIGLVFEQRVAGVRSLQKVHEELYPEVVFAQLLGLVDAIMLDDRRDPADKIKVWDRICLGTDYDGLIDPVSIYPTAISLDRFADDLHAMLAKISHTRMIAEIGVDELVEKICWKNAHDFTRTHLPTVCR